MPRKKQITNTQALSSSGKVEMDQITEKVFDELNKKELEKSLDRWLKANSDRNSIAMRDLGVLKSIITEYLDTFILFGYNIDGERIILQHYISSKDRDAIMEFLKTIFIRQQQDNFLD
jgi:hypothetical protein